MSKQIRHALGLEKRLYCFEHYSPPLSPVIKYFPFDKKDLREVEIVGEWGPTRVIEMKEFDKDTLIHHYIWGKDKKGYLYVYDKVTKKRYHDPKYKYKVYESGFIVREKIK